MQDDNKHSKNARHLSEVRKDVPRRHSLNIQRFTTRYLTAQLRKRSERGGGGLRLAPEGHVTFSFYPDFI